MPASARTGSLACPVLGEKDRQVFDKIVVGYAGDQAGQDAQ